MATILFQGVFPSLLGHLQNMGFFLYLFPFLLSLAILYGIMKFAFKDRLPNSAMGLIAIILSFFVMLFAGQNPNIVNFFTLLSGGGLIIGSAILFILIMLGLVGFNFDKLFEGKDNKNFRWGVILVVILVVILLVFGAGAGGIVSLPSWASGSDFVTVLFFVFILAIAMWWLGSEGETKDKGGGQKTV